MRVIPVLRCRSWRQVSNLVRGIAVVVLILGSIYLMSPAEVSGSTPAAARSRDVLVLDGSMTVRVVDHQTGTVYDHPILGKDGSYDLRSFSRAESLVLDSIVGTRNGYTVTFDRRTKKLVLAIGSKRVSAINIDDADSVTSVDVSANGEVAVAKQQSISRYSRALAERPSIDCEECEEVSKILYDGATLYVYDRGRRLVLSADPDDTTLHQVINFSKLAYEPADIAVIRGVVYVCGGKVISVGTRRSKVITTFSVKDSEQLSGIAATGDYLLLLTGDRVLVRSRLTPVTLRFDGDASKTTTALANLYAYLRRNDLLATRDTTVKRDMTIGELLVSEHLFPVLPSDTGLTTAIDPVLTDLNPKLPSSRFRPNADLPIQRGTPVSLPDVAVESYIAIELVDLGATSIDAYLKSRISSETDRAHITNDYIAALNGLESSLELEELAKKRGYCLLPVTRWRASVYVSVSDINNPSSDLHQLMNVNAVRILSAEEAPRTASVCDGARSADSKIEDAQKNREWLRAAINYPEALVTSQPYTVAIAEEAHSIDRNHPDFFDAQGHSIWQVNAASPFGLVTDESPVRESTAPNVRAFRTADDHGTHVAGIIAARGATAPGLVPNARLYLIDATTPTADGMESAIDEAIKRGVRLFNFSNLFNDADATWNVVRDKIAGAGARSVFIVAAGNNGTLLTEQSSVAAPLRWASLPNVIGVGAANDCEDVLGDILEAGGIGPGSNHGPTYVHLLAPGLNIYSCARDAGYAEGCGTSDAAPQVTAAAAALMQAGVRDPSIIKTRLLYTADWRSQYLFKVLGGRLNVTRAVTNQHANLLWVESAPKVPFILAFDRTAPTTVKIKSAQWYPSGSTQIPFDIPFRNVLRLRRQPNGRYRIIYLDEQPQHTMYRTLYDAVILQPVSVPCTQLRASESAVPPPSNETLTSLCAGNVPIVQVLDYIAELPDTPVEFP